MIPNGEGWYYIAAKLSVLLKEILSKHHSGFYCFNYLHTFETGYKCESPIYHVAMSSKDTKILEFNQYHKSDKARFIIYAHLEYLREKFHGCKKNPENSFTLGFPISTISLFKSIENKHDV